MSLKKWNLYLVAGNPEKRSRVTLSHLSPMVRSQAIEEAKKLAKHDWRVWVEDSKGERIFESDTEKAFREKASQSEQ